MQKRGKYNIFLSFKAINCTHNRFNKKKNMKRFNIYYLFDCMLALATVSFFLSKRDIKFLYGAIILVIVTGILVWLESKEKTQLTQTVVTNNSDNTIKFKPESESEPGDISPHSSVKGVDGIKVSGKVFKASSGTHVVIESNGKIKTKSLSGKVANTISGGYITSAPDPSWQHLFDA